MSDLTPTMHRTGRPVTVDDLVRVRWPMQPALSPDGRNLAFVVSGLDRDEDRLVYRLHRHDVESGETVRLAEGVRARRPKWSPEADRLAFISGPPGAAQVAVLDAQGRTVGTTALPGGVTGFAWAPDGRGVACAVSEDADPAHGHNPYLVRSRADLAGDHERRGLWVAWPEEGRERELLPAEWGPAWSPVWSPDGTAIAFLSERGGDVLASPGTQIWRADADGANLRCLLDGGGAVTALAWSPDTSEIAYLGHVHGATPGVNNELWVVDAGGGTPRSLSAELDRSIGQAVRGDDERAVGPPDLVWTPGGDRILAIFADGGVSGIGWFGRDGRSGMAVGGNRSILEFDAARDRDGTIAFSWSDPWNPGELSVGHLDAPSDRPCTDLNGAWCETVSLAPTRPVSYEAPDGVRVEGWLTEPADVADGPVPLVVEVHGGPHYPVGWRFSMNAQRLAAQGYAVLRANPRGSQGYGASHALAVHGDWGGQDYRDLMGLVDATLDVVAVDPDRLAIMGESYGGFMANWAITQTDRFAAAVSENGLCDFFSAAAHRSNAAFWHAEMGGPPWDRPGLYAERSPLLHVRAIDTPLLLVQAGLDATSQSEEMFVALTLLGADVALARVPDEGHWVNVFGAPSRRLARTRIVDDWLAQRLAKAPT